MTIQAGVGVSTNRNPKVAGKEAAKKALDAAEFEFLNDIQQKIGPKTPWIGFYTLGEIGPVGNYNCFHNYSIVLAALY
jgi:hypothetical protein